MIRKRPASERGHADHGWLDTHYSFSFADYHDPEHMGFRALRVLNEDTIEAGRGFPPHGHRDMEILTYVLEGALEHRDSTGNGSVLRPGDVQRMTAGRGIRHSERNPAPGESLHLLQIWILPSEPGLTPGYEEKHFPAGERRGRLRLLATPGGEDGSLDIHQDVRVSAGLLEPGESVVHPLAPGRHLWVQVARGDVLANGEALGRGDGAAVSEETSVTLSAQTSAEILVFDLA